MRWFSAASLQVLSGKVGQRFLPLTLNPTLATTTAQRAGQSLSACGRANSARKHQSLASRSIPEGIVLVRYPPIGRRASASSSGANLLSCTESAAVVPLCEQEPSFIASLSEVAKWYECARLKAAAVGRRFADQDGGPDAEELCQELEWLLDDAVAQVSYGRHASSAGPAVAGRGDEDPAAGSWQDCSWKLLTSRHLSAGGSAAGQQGPKPRVSRLAPSEVDGATSVHLRTSLQRLDAMWRDRIEDRVPFQYIVGAAHWHDLILAVGPGVLIPRPETELLVELAAAAMDADGSLASGLWADLGTGSGAVAVGLARLLPRVSHVFAVDLSPVAVAAARDNVRRYNLQERVTCLEGDWFTPLAARGLARGQLAGVLSNPPYIPAEHLPGLQAEVRFHEPWSALDGGPAHGLASLQAICEGAAEALRPGGFLALETNGGEQAERVAAFLRRLSFHNVECRADLASVVRFVTAVHQ